MWLTQQDLGLSEISSTSWGGVLKAFGVVILLCLTCPTEFLGNKIAVVRGDHCFDAPCPCLKSRIVGNDSEIKQREDGQPPTHVTIRWTVASDTVHYYCSTVLVVPHVFAKIEVYFQKGS
jgi:hypothetical protein